MLQLETQIGDLVMYLANHANSRDAKAHEELKLAAQELRQKNQLRDQLLKK